MDAAATASSGCTSIRSMQVGWRISRVSNALAAASASPAVLGVVSVLATNPGLYRHDPAP
jgi:hypothetical protein